MSIYKEALWNDGQALDHGDMNNMSRWLRAQMLETLAAGALDNELSTVPTVDYLYCFSGAGAAPYTTGVGLTVTNPQGVVAQRMSGSVDGSDPKFIAYYVDQAELATTLSAADPTNPRLDLIAVKLDYVSNTSVSRDSMDPAGVESTQSFNSSRSVQLTKQVVVGTPGATPSEPSVPSGYVKWAVVRVEAAATTVSNFTICDYRMPVGLKAFDVLGTDGVAEDLTKWPGANIYERIHTDSGLDTAQFFPRAGGNMGRIVRIEMIRMWTTGGGTPVANVIRSDAAYAVLATPPSTTVVSTSSALVGSADTLPIMKALDLTGEAFWTNGYRGGFAATKDALYTALKCTKAGLEWVPGGAGATDKIRLVRFWIAGA